MNELFQTTGGLGQKPGHRQQKKLTVTLTVTLKVIFLKPLPCK